MSEDHDYHMKNVAYRGILERYCRQGQGVLQCCVQYTVKILLFVGHQFSWFSWVQLTKKFGSRQTEHFAFICQIHEFKNPLNCIVFLNHENSQYTRFDSITMCKIYTRLINFTMLFTIYTSHL